MTTDRELMELVAKAVGGVLSEGHTKRRTGPTWDTWEWIGPPGINVGGVVERPLIDNGDALRLAVRLGMELSTNLHHRFVMVNGEQEFYDEAKFGGVCDPEGVMRRAIARAAAEIGRAMP